MTTTPPTPQEIAAKAVELIDTGRIKLGKGWFYFDENQNVIMTSGVDELTGQPPEVIALIKCACTVGIINLAANEFGLGRHAQPTVELKRAVKSTLPAGFDGIPEWSDHPNTTLNDVRVKLMEQIG